MHWKIILATVAILGIAGLLVYQVGNFNIGLPGFSALPSKSGSSFPIILSTNLQPFFGKSYDVANVTITAEGICVGKVSYDPSLVNFTSNGAQCKTSVSLSDGQLSFDTSGIKLSSSLIDFVLIPENFVVGGFSVNKLELDNVDGNVQRLKNSVWSSEPLVNESIEINKYLGILRITNANVTLSGYAAQLKGQGFTWSG
jgi:hypothetical protein